MQHIVDQRYRVRARCRIGQLHGEQHSTRAGCSQRIGCRVPAKRCRLGADRDALTLQLRKGRCTWPIGSERDAERPVINRFGSTGRRLSGVSIQIPGASSIASQCVIIDGRRDRCGRRHIVVENGNGQCRTRSVAVAVYNRVTEHFIGCGGNAVRGRIGPGPGGEVQRQLTAKWSCHINARSGNGPAARNRNRAGAVPGVGDRSDGDRQQPPAIGTESVVGIKIASNNSWLEQGGKRRYQIAKIGDQYRCADAVNIYLLQIAVVDTAANANRRNVDIVAVNEAVPQRPNSIGQGLAART